jgi:hypothetical protein
MSEIVIHEPLKYVRNVAVNNLRHSDMPVIRHQVELLRLHACRVHGLPFKIFLCSFGVGSRLSLLGHGLDRGGSVYGLLSTSHIGQPIAVYR